MKHGHKVLGNLAGDQCILSSSAFCFLGGTKAVELKKWRPVFYDKAGGTCEAFSVLHVKARGKVETA